MAKQRGHKVEGAWVFGGVERLEKDSRSDFQEKVDKNRAGKCFAFVVADRTEATLLPIIKEFIREGSIVVTDCWPAYNRIGRIRDRYYDHITVNHSERFVDPTTGACTNTIEGLWGSRFKRRIPRAAYNEYALEGHLFKVVWLGNHKKNLWDSIWNTIANIRYGDDGKGYLVENSG